VTAIAGTSASAARKISSRVRKARDLSNGVGSALGYWLLVIGTGTVTATGQYQQLHRYP
jgi:hypothetical protein